MRRIVVVLATLVVASCNQGKQGESMPPAAGIAAAASIKTETAPAKSEFDCAAKDAKLAACNAHAELQKVLSALQVLGAELAIDKIVGRKIKPMSSYDIADSRLRRIEAAVAQVTNDQVKPLFLQFRAAYLACEHTIYAAKSDDADDVADTCAYNVQRQADAISRALNVQMPKTQPDIFGMTWGMTVADAMRTNPKCAAVDVDNITCDTTINGNDSTIVLKFVGDKLWEAFYVVHAKHANQLTYLDDFEQIDRLLKDKYGVPVSSGPQWADSLYKDDPSGWGMAVATGRMDMRSEWSVPRTKITHLLTGDNYDINHYLAYQSREFKRAAAQARDDAKKSQL